MNIDFASSVSGYNCNVLPESMNGAKFEKGCPGAVYNNNGNGNPSREYCTNTGSSNGRFPWWNACCQWKDGKCIKKQLGNIFQLPLNKSKTGNKFSIIEL